MIKYAVDKNTSIKNYGIKDIILKGSCLKNLGAIGSDKYLFEVGINNPESKKYEIEKQIGDIVFLITFYKNTNDFRIVISYEGNEPISLFHYESIIGILEECKKIKDDLNLPIRINIPSQLISDSNNDSIVMFPYDTNDAYEIEKEFYDLMDFDSAIDKMNYEKEKLLPSIEREEVKEKSKVLSLFPFLRKQK